MTDQAETSDTRRAGAREDHVPMLAIFGGFFGFLLAFLVLVNYLAGASVQERLESISESGVYRIDRPDGSGSGYVVISFPDSVKILETGASVEAGSVCSNPEFTSYAQKIYGRPGNQIVFLLLEGSIPVMAEARNCLRNLMPGQPLTIGWVIADNDFLKSVALNDIPPYIERYVEDAP